MFKTCQYFLQKKAKHLKYSIDDSTEDVCTWVQTLMWQLRKGNHDVGSIYTLAFQSQLMICQFLYVGVDI